MSRARTAMGHTAYHHVGDDTSDAATSLVNPPDTTIIPGSSGGFFSEKTWQFIRIAAIGAAAYHGYRRNSSVGWAVGWGLLAGLSPPIVIGVALAEGFAKPKRSST